MSIKPIFIAALALAAAGCATQTGWRPTVDPAASRHPERITADLAECEQLAIQASGWTPGEAARGAAVGGLVGAAAGAAIGAAAGSPGRGAAIGAAAGGLGGGAREGLSAEEQYKRAYSNCMRNRGHSVLN